MEKFTMPAGKYYIGDLCYVLRNERWAEFCELTIKDGECLHGDFFLKDGSKFCFFNTWYGDGTYTLRYNRSVSVAEIDVDSGTIGCILVDDLLDFNEENCPGAVVEFMHEFQVSEEEGVIRFGAYSIDTADE